MRKFEVLREGSMTTKTDEARAAVRIGDKVRKPYSPPMLQKWGTLKDVTLSNGHHGNKDGGKGKQLRRTR
jgi:hypothetical protein